MANAIKISDFAEVNNTFVTDNALSTNKIEVEIGDIKQPDFKPQFKVKRWDNEVNFSMRAIEDPTATVDVLQDSIKYKAKDYDVHLYVKPDAGKDGGFEFEWVLNQKPKSNVLTSTIQSKGLDFFYQPELTDAEAQPLATRKGISLLEAKRYLRPEHIVGSYAVYISEHPGNWQGGNEYKAGKVFHIHRPKAIDANGEWTWAELNIDQEAGTLQVTVPESFLDTATYPVVVDPSFGYTSLGGSKCGPSRTKFWGTRFANSASGIGSSMSGAIANDLGTGAFFKMLIVKQSDLNILTNGITQENTMPYVADGFATDFTTIGFSSSPSNAGVDHVLGYIHDDYAFAVYTLYDSGTANYYYFDSTNNYTTPTNPTDAVTTGDDNGGGNNVKLSIYYTYTATTAPSVSDTVTITDTPTIRVVSRPNVSDTVTITDSPSLSVKSFPAVSDSITVTDAPTISIITPVTNLNVSVSDATTVTDAPTLSLKSVVSVSDATTVTDAPTVITVYLPSVSDQTTLTDTPTISIASKVSVSDSATVTDTPNLSLRSVINVSDSTTVMDSPTLSLASRISVSDSTTVTDAPTLSLASKISVSDSTTVTDFPTVLLPTLTFSVSDSTTVSDAPTINLVSLINVFDSTAVTDLPYYLDDVVQVSENVSLSILNLVPALSVSVSDTVTVSDNPTLSPVSYISVSDAATITDTLTVLLTYLVPSASDSTTLTDSPTLSLTSNVSASDTATLTDTPNLSLTSVILVSDSTTVSDSPILAVSAPQVSASDTATLTESVTVVVSSPQVSVSDTVTVSEQVTLILAVNASTSDTITLSEAVTLLLLSPGSINVADSTTITDLPTILIPTLFPSVSDSVVVPDSGTPSLASYIAVQDQTTVSDGATISIVVVSGVKDYYTGGISLSKRLRRGLGF